MSEHLPWPITQWAQKAPDAIALRTPSREWSYAELAEHIDFLAGCLRSLGIGGGSKVALYESRSAKLVALLWALWRIGAIAAPLNTRLPDEALQSRLRHIEPDLLIAPRDASAPSSVPRRTLKALENEHHSSSKVALPDPEALPSDRPATLIFTSGSTGSPRLAQHSFANHFYSAKGSNRNIPVSPGDSWLLSLPLYHVGGLAILFRCALGGATVQVQPETSGMRSGLPEGATHLSLVATQFERLLAAERHPPPVVKAVLLGGGPIPERLIERGKALNWPLFASYGLTEMSSQVATTPPKAGAEALKTAGATLDYREVTLSDEGEILVRGRTLFDGYLREDGALEKPFDDAGWFATGDRGAWDGEGRLLVKGRMDQMIISGGENIQPAEVENALCRHPGVELAVVVGIPDPEYGERPIGFVRRVRGAPTLEEIKVALAEDIPKYKMPDAIYPLLGWGEGSGLKPDRARLADVARALRDRQREA